MRYDEKLIEEKNMEILSCMLRERNLQVSKGLPFWVPKLAQYSWKEKTRNGQEKSKEESREEKGREEKGREEESREEEGREEKSSEEKGSEEKSSEEKSRSQKEKISE